MPKASSDPKDMYSPSGRGFIETLGTEKSGEITNACYVYTQFNENKTTHVQLAPLTVFRVSIAEIDKDGNRVAEPIDNELVMEFGPQDGSMIKLRPGLADSATEEPADTMDENGNMVLGTEGSTIFCSENFMLNMKLPYGIFALSCKEHGYKPEVLKNSYAPDFIGTRAVFALELDKGGRKKKDGSDITNLVVKSFIKFPYEKSAAAPAKVPAKAPAKAAAKAAAPASAPAKVNGAAAAAPAPADGDIEAICIDALKKVSDKVSATTSDALTRQKIIVLSIQQVLAPNSGVDKSKHQAIQAQLKDQAWFEENAISFGAVNSGDDKYMMVGTS